MKFATIEVNGHYRATLTYDVINVTEDDFTRDGQRIELYSNSRLVAVVYGRIHPASLSKEVSDTYHIDEIIIKIAE